MRMDIPISSTVERWLRETAAQRGITIEALTAEMLERATAEPAAPQTTNGAAGSPEDWSQRWQAWADSHTPLGGLLDDDRETIYAGRGE